jgi:NAD+ diphosphatase
MTEIHPYPPNALAGSPLDRAGPRRADAAWIADLLADPAARFLPVWRTRNLMRTGPEGGCAVFVKRAAIAHALADAPWAFLGLLDGAPLFTVDLSPLETPLTLPEGAAFADLRMSGGVVAPEDASMMAHARGLMHWRLRHRFCGVCGAACVPVSAGHVMACQGCGAQHFPRTDPAVIMLVTDGERALLGRPAGFRAMRMFTTLAGFVEPGESLEEAVAREVFEETGVRVAHVRYHSSQPWPFPGSIMLGFSAVARSSEIRVDPDEITEAAWFTRAELRAPEGFVIPPSFSIAGRMIRDWING